MQFLTERKVLKSLLHNVIVLTRMQLIDTLPTFSSSLVLNLKKKIFFLTKAQ